MCVSGSGALSVESLSHSTSTDAKPRGKREVFVEARQLVTPLSGTRALQLRNAREARGGKKKSSRDEHGVLAGPQRGLIVLFSKVYI